MSTNLARWIRTGLWALVFTIGCASHAPSAPTQPTAPPVAAAEPPAPKAQAAAPIHRGAWRKKAAPADAKEWEGKTGKLDLLER